MPTKFIGFNTIGQQKKFTLTGFDLIKRDLLNAFNIQQGSLPGRPGYGTTIWNYLFENQIEATQKQIEREIQRVAAQDPRFEITQIQVAPQQNGILVQLALTVVPSTDAEFLAIFFDNQQQSASYQ